MDLETRLAVLRELREDVEAKLADAEALAQESGMRSRSPAARLSREDAASYRRQLVLLDDLQMWLLAARPQGVPAQADFVPARTRPTSAGPSAARRRIARQRARGRPVGHRCKPCSHPSRGELDAMLARGVPLASIGRRFGLSKDSLWRHRRGGHIPEPVALAHKAAMLRKGLHIDLDKLRIEESEGLLLGLARQRAVLLDAQDRAREAEQYANVAALGAQVHRNLQLVGQYLGEFAQHQTRVTHNLILAPEYLQLRAGLIEALRPFPEARRAVAEVLRRVEGSAARWDGVPQPKAPPVLIEGNGRAG